MKKKKIIINIPENQQIKKKIFQLWQLKQSSVLAMSESNFVSTL